MDTQNRANLVLKIYIRVLLYVNNDFNNNKITTFLTYLNDLVRQNKIRESEEDEFKSIDQLYVESTSNKNLLKYEEECKKSQAEPPVIPAIPVPAIPAKPAIIPAIKPVGPVVIPVKPAIPIPEAVPEAIKPVPEPEPEGDGAIKPKAAAGEQQVVGPEINNDIEDILLGNKKIEAFQDNILKTLYPKLQEIVEKGEPVLLFNAPQTNSIKKLREKMDEYQRLLRDGKTPTPTPTPEEPETTISEMSINEIIEELRENRITSDEVVNVFPTIDSINNLFLIVLYTKIYNKKEEKENTKARSIFDAIMNSPLNYSTFGIYQRNARDTIKGNSTFYENVRSFNEEFFFYVVAFFLMLNDENKGQNFDTEYIKTREGIDYINIIIEKSIKFYIYINLNHRIKQRFNKLQNASKENFYKLVISQVKTDKNETIFDNDNTETLAKFLTEAGAVKEEGVVEEGATPVAEEGAVGEEGAIEEGAVKEEGVEAGEEGVVEDGAEEPTQQQTEIFTNFEQHLNAYKPPSDSKTYKYKDYGKIIDENYKDNRNIIRTKRVEILIDTLKKFEANINTYYTHAKQNMLRWCKYVKPRASKGLEVIVKEMDWGEMALECTKKYKSIFACLNMANETSPGGGYNHGPAAQEENMFRRTDCHFSIDRKRDLNDNGTYNKTMRDLISGHQGTTYIDVEEPRICIKGKENGDGTPTPDNLKVIGHNLSNIGYDELPNENIFLFYELRCAAVYINKGENFNPVQMKKRIDAQFETLKREGVRHAILGAFGCGAFNNPPDQVATLYKDCLERYKNDFDVIAFPIYYAGSGANNYPTFREILLNSLNDETTSIFYGAEEGEGAPVPAKNKTRRVSWGESRRDLSKQKDTRRRR